MIASFAYSFRSYGLKNLDNQATIIAKIVEGALTTQMETGVINKRELFLNQIENLPHIDRVWLSRSQAVIDMYGKGETNELPQDEIDKEVLKTGKTIKIIDEKLFTSSTYRITIPYKAHNQGAINCVTCHINTEYGDTLGAISIEIPIDASKKASISTIIRSFILGMILVALIGFLINNIISPFLKLFDAIKIVMNKAQDGDYSYRILYMENKDALNVILWINTLLTKVEDTLKDIDNQISIFLADKGIKEKDSLINVKNTIHRLSEIYKFRKTVELDDSIEDIYSRLAYMIKKYLNIDDFNLIETNHKSNEIEYVYVSKQKHCDPSKGCRADKTSDVVDSTIFSNLCTSCETQSKYICIPFSISSDLVLIVSIYAKSEQEIQNTRENIAYLRDYVEAAKSVITTYKLMSILEKTAKTDPLTNLHNRTYLKEQTPRITSNAQRADIKYGILMLDIDYFKHVNDTYGHEAGDDVLKILAQTLLESTRDSDIVIRMGGEEFLILLYNCSEENLLVIAEKIRETFMSTNITVGNKIINKTISIGASMFPTDSKDLEICTKYADLALYESKNKGRNRVTLFTPNLLKKESLN